MKKTRYLLLVLMILLGARSWAQQDSVDVIDYSLVLDIDHQFSQTLLGSADITFRVLSPCQSISFDLQSGRVDSVLVNGNPVEFEFAESRITFPAAGLADTQRVHIRYSTGSFVEPGGWGGFHMGTSLHYNLGVSFGLYPHGFGRAWFPCRDNFYDKATYHLTVTSAPGFTAQAGGMLEDEHMNADGSYTSTWSLEHPTPTYLYSVALAPFHKIQRYVQSIYGIYPATIAFTHHDSTAVFEAYRIIDHAVPMFERCFGPYRWDRIGYVSTPKGSMEHVNNIALVSNCMASLSEKCQGVICHELSHAWFGNLITCASSQDMWINEGGASFCTEVAFEAAYGRAYANGYYNRQLESVLLMAHHSDGGVLALHGVTPSNTYGSTTYDKGHLVWHALRGYLGDSLFYAATRTLFERNAFANMDACQMRDSMSLYSGTDLADFFNFHVFGRGFADYVLDRLSVDGLNATVAVRQQLRFADAYCASSRVPVTFFGDGDAQCKRWIEFSDSVATAAFSLPFEARYAVINHDYDILTATTYEDTVIAANSGRQFDPEYLYIFNTSSEPIRAQVEHHFTAPQGDFPEGVERIPLRYWTLNVSDPVLARMQFYHFGGGYPYLDEGFYTEQSQCQRFGLLYRRDASEPWRLVSRVRKGNADAGSIEYRNAVSGDYCIAEVDSALGISIPVETMGSFLSPNPSKGRFKANAPQGCSLQVFSLNGTLVAEFPKAQGTINLSNLAPATYVARLIDSKGRIISNQKIIKQ